MICLAIIHHPTDFPPSSPLTHAPPNHSNRAIFPVTLWLTNHQPSFPNPLLLLPLPPFHTIRPGSLPPISITPPSTRKRKAAEAAITDDQPLPESATKAAHTHTQDATLVSRSRKPDETGPATTQSTETGSTASFTSQKKRVLATPATTDASMDSDDDFMSDVSSQDDFLDMQGSDDESLGEGTYQLASSVSSSQHSDITVVTTILISFSVPLPLSILMSSTNLIISRNRFWRLRYRILRRQRPAQAETKTI